MMPRRKILSLTLASPRTHVRWTPPLGDFLAAARFPLTPENPHKASPSVETSTSGDVDMAKSKPAKKSGKRGC